MYWERDDKQTSYFCCNMLCGVVWLFRVMLWPTKRASVEREFRKWTPFGQQLRQTVWAHSMPGEVSWAQGLLWFVWVWGATSVVANFSQRTSWGSNGWHSEHLCTSIFMSGGHGNEVKMSMLCFSFWKYPGQWQRWQSNKTFKTSFPGRNAKMIHVCECFLHPKSPRRTHQSEIKTWIQTEFSFHSLQLPVTRRSRTKVFHQKRTEEIFKAQSFVVEEQMKEEFALPFIANACSFLTVFNRSFGCTCVRIQTFTDLQHRQRNNFGIYSLQLFCLSRFTLTFWQNNFNLSDCHFQERWAFSFMILNITPSSSWKKFEVQMFFL